jgi:hypothetical protein
MNSVFILLLISLNMVGGIYIIYLAVLWVLDLFFPDY